MYLMGIYPFGDISMRITDAISQYPAFFEGLKDGDLFTFKIGLGTNFYTIFTTYLASPLSFLYLFFENYQFDLFFEILVLLKIGLIGLNMNILLNYKKERNKYSLIFSTIYALSGFVSLYYFNYQFLDALYMLPLIMIGIEKLVNDNKNLMYFITLTLMIIFHYYTAYMICIFSVIYFFFLLVNFDLDKMQKKRRIIKFFSTSLFCGLCSSFITIPSFYSLMQGRNSYFNDLNYFSFNKDSLSLFYNFTAGSTFLRDLVNTSTPVFITLFIIVLVIFSLFNKNYTKKYRISIFIILLLFILSTSFNLFYYGWHFFQRPVGLPGRFIFVFNCFFVLIAYRTYITNKFNNKKLLFKIVLPIIGVLLIIISYFFELKLNANTIYTVDNRYIILLFLNLFIFIYYIFFIFNKKFVFLTYFLIFLEIIINLICSFNISFAYKDYNYLLVTENTEYIKANKTIYNNVLISNKEFCRLEKVGTYNDGLLYGYNGINVYSSLYNQNLRNFLTEDNIKFSAITGDHLISYNTEYLLDIILGLKYVISNISDNLILSERNLYLNSIGFMFNSNYVDELKSYNDLFSVYNKVTSKKIEEKQLIPKITLENVEQKNDLFSLIDSNKDGKISYEYFILEDSWCSLDIHEDIEFKNLNTGIVYSSDEVITLYVNDKIVKSVSYLKKGDIVKLEIRVPKDLKAIYNDFKFLKYINYENLKKMVDDLNNNVVTNLKFNKLGFSGNLEVTNDKKLLIITVPYDESIEIYANGVKQETLKILGGITSVVLDEGIYNIAFKYRIKGLKMGIIISLISLFIFTVLKVLAKKYIRSYNSIDNKEEIKK